MWDEKAKLERDSIESQTRAERITELWIAGKIPDEDSLIPKLRAWLGKLGSDLPGPIQDTTEEIGEAPPLKNLGHLYTRAAKYGLSPRDILSSVKEVHPEISKAEEITDLDEAWVTTAKRFASTIKAAQEAFVYKTSMKK